MAADKPCPLLQPSLGGSGLFCHDSKKETASKPNATNLIRKIVVHISASKKEIGCDFWPRLHPIICSCRNSLTLLMPSIIFAHFCSWS